MAVIQSVKVKAFTGENGDSVEREIKLTDKIKALELLGKHLGMYNNKDEDKDTYVRIEVVNDLKKD